ncbi:hypothetical protein FNF27_05006 [Cafeteria roenbergensis]|uniref:ABC transporter domain-containing protein n=1 Tax=Cafeteria roenbergensis TaxID=33653 RepID=A0A5A8EC96_CAFRO|nr:hypothetical protein FNF29_00631 [Cafeteria roenbergensis]KAA0173511.1 hypothetical protein FNF27_05006 [Cafeteria roenbergensis]|eukprot:KAA0157279.1 hypothetical protein FNF29_00631 [Cafeteria roenbergensis]
MASPAPPSKKAGAALEWRGLGFEVPAKDPKTGKTFTKRILSSISGKAKAGTLTLLMGPSGAGKTSLLRLLSRRVTPTEGTILLNGHAPDYRFRRVHGFVEQEVAMFDTLTVREILSSTARLKLPERVGAQELEERVNKVVDALDISKCVDTQVGKCSGGEKRRLAVAAELLGEPSLIFLDEPTSGLDGASALNVMTILRRLAHEQNRTIICTIHQPRASLMPLADQLLLLADGRQVYAGPTWTDGRRDGMLGYLAALGFPSPSFENPADFVVDLVNSSAEEDRAVAAADKDAGSPAAGTDGKAAEHSAEAGRSDADEAEQAASLRAAVHAAKEAAQETADGLDVTGWQAESEAARLSALAPSDRIAEAAAIRAARSRAEFIEWLAAQFSASRLSEEGRTALTPDELPADPLAAAGDDGHRSRFPTGFCTQVGVVLRRVFLFKLREPEAVASLAASVLMMSVIVGMVYWQLPLTTSGLQDRLGFLSLFLISIAFSPLDLVLLIPRERSVFLRDTNANLYGTLAFYVGRTLADIPFHVGFSAVGAVIAYWMAGFQADAAKCGIFVLLTVILMFGTTSLFMAVGSLSPNVATANGIVSIVLLLAMLFSGIFVAQENTPVVFRWIGDISYLRFGVEAAATSELTGLSVSCTPQEAALGCVTTGAQLLERNSFNTDLDYIWPAMGWIVLQGVIFRVISLGGLHFLFTKQTLGERWRAAFEW